METAWNIGVWVAWAFLAVCGVAYLTGISLGLAIVLALGALGIVALGIALWPREDRR